LRNTSWDQCLVGVMVVVMAIGAVTAIGNPFALVHAQGFPNYPAFAQAVMLSNSGKWSTVEPPSVMVPAVINSGATYVLIAGTISTVDPTVVPYLEQMKAAGIQLGCGIYPQQGWTEDQLVQQAQTMYNMGFFSWIHIDNSLDVTFTPDLVSQLYKQGWSDVLLHETGFGDTGKANPTSGWAHDKNLYLLSNANPNPNLNGPVILQPDIDWLDYDHENFPNQITSLALEIPSEMSKFATLPVAQQERLLTEWAGNQSVYGYVFDYPLFFPARNSNSGITSYDSIAQGTYQYEVALIKNPRPATMTSSSTPSSIIAVSSSKSSTFASAIVTNPSPSSTSSAMTSPAIPGFPWESIITGIILGILAIAIAKRRRKLRRR